MNVLLKGSFLRALVGFSKLSVISPMRCVAMVMISRCSAVAPSRVRNVAVMTAAANEYRGQLVQRAWRRLRFFILHAACLDVFQSTEHVIENGAKLSDFIAAIVYMNAKRCIFRCHD